MIGCDCDYDSVGCGVQLQKLSKIPSADVHKIVNDTSFNQDLMI